MTTPQSSNHSPRWCILVSAVFALGLLSLQTEKQILEKSAGRVSSFIGYEESQQISLVSNVASAIARFEHPIIHQATQAPPPYLHCNVKDQCIHSLQYVAIGQVKCGTATLTDLASIHPKVRNHRKNLAEMNFFDNVDSIAMAKRNLYSKLLLLERNTEPVPKRDTNLREAVDDGYFYGEHSPQYMYAYDHKCKLIENRQTREVSWNCQNPGFVPDISSLINKMKAVLSPDILIVMTLRSPTNRAYSHFSHFSGPCQNELGQKLPRERCFHDFVVKEINDVEICFRLMGELHPECVQLPFDIFRKDRALVRLGLYAIYIKLWHAHFPNLCILDVVTEANKQPGNEGLKQVARDFEYCLGIDRLNQTEERVFNDKIAEMEHESQSKRFDPMWNITRQMLDRFYAPYNKLLCDMVPHTCEWSWVAASIDYLESL